MQNTTCLQRQHIGEGQYTSVSPRAELAILVCELPLANLLRTAVRCSVQPAVGIDRHLVSFVLADVHSLCDVFEDRQQSLDPHIKLCTV